MFCFVNWSISKRKRKKKSLVLVWFCELVNQFFNELFFFFLLGFGFVRDSHIYKKDSSVILNILTWHFTANLFVYIYAHALWVNVSRVVIFKKESNAVGTHLPLLFWWKSMGSEWHPCLRRPYQTLSASLMRSGLHEQGSHLIPDFRVPWLT